MVVLSVQVLDPVQGWCVINQRELKEGMSDKEKAELTLEIAQLWDGWAKSDEFIGLHLRVHHEVVDPYASAKPTGPVSDHIKVIDEPR